MKVSKIARLHRQIIFDDILKNLINQGMTDAQIADELNKRNVPAMFAAGPWNADRARNLRRAKARDADSQNMA